MANCGDCPHLRIVSSDDSAAYMCAYTPNVIDNGAAVSLSFDEKFKPIAYENCTIAPAPSCGLVCRLVNLCLRRGVKKDIS